MSTYFLLLLLLIVGLIVVVMLFFKWMGKINKRVATSGKKRTFGQEIAVGFHVIFHPFDGFWDLKHEKRGSLRAAIVYVAVTVVAFFYQAIGRGYSYNPRGDYSTVFIQVIAVVIPVA